MNWPFVYNHSSSSSMQWQIIKNRSEVNQKACLPSNCSHRRSFRTKKKSSRYSLDLVPLCVKSQQIPSNSSWLILSHIFILPLYPAAALTCHCSASMVQEAGGNFWRSDCPPASWGCADGARHSRHLSPPAVRGLLPSIFLSCTWNKVTTDMQEPKGSGSSLVSLQRRFLCDRNQAGEGVAWKGWGDAILGGAQNPTVPAPEQPHLSWLCGGHGLTQVSPGAPIQPKLSRGSPECRSDV